MEFEWKNFPGLTTLGILEEIQKMMTELQCEPEQFKGENEETQNNVLRILLQVRIMLADSLAVVGPSWDLDQRRNGTQPILINRWDKTAERMVLNFAESGLPIFRATSSLDRGEWRSKEKGKNVQSTHSLQQ